MKTSLKLTLIFGLLAVAGIIAYFVFFKNSTKKAVATPSGLGTDDDALFLQAMSVIKQYTPSGAVDWLTTDFDKRMKGDLPLSPDAYINGIPSKGLALLETYSSEYWGPGYHGEDANGVPNGKPGSLAINYAYINGGTNKIVGDKIWALASAFRTKKTIEAYSTPSK